MLCHHYASKGNVSRRIAEVEMFKKTLTYKHERTMPYETLLDMFQKMCTIYKEEQEPLTNQAKCHELLCMLKGLPILSSAISTLIYQLNIGQLTYTVATNHLQSVVSENNANTTTISEISSLAEIGG